MSEPDAVMQGSLVVVERAETGRRVVLWSAVSGMGYPEGEPESRQGGLWESQVDMVQLYQRWVDIAVDREDDDGEYAMRSAQAFRRVEEVMFMFGVGPVAEGGETGDETMEEIDDELAGMVWELLVKVEGGLWDRVREAIRSWVCGR